MSELHWLGATELASAFAARRCSPVELIDALLARIAALDPGLDVFVHLAGEEARDAARVAEREIAAGRLRGPLHGIPIGLKDNIDVAGVPTTCHSRLMLGRKAAHDAAVVERLRAAGAILIGKVALNEFATGSTAFDLPFPPARNPWNRDHHPGGSSSGSAAGLAAGFFPLALGTDTGGSVRHPAGVCGVVGLKPTYGVVSRRGTFPLSFTLDHVGPMARSVADVALLLETIAAHDLHDPGSVPADGRACRRDLDRGVAGLRIGFVRHFHETDVPADAEMATALEEVATVLAHAGATVRTVTLPALKEFFTVNRVILQSEAFAVHGRDLRERPAMYGRTARRRLLTGGFLAAEDYVQAQRLRSRLVHAVEAAFSEYDVLLTASSMNLTCRIDDREAIERTLPRQARTPFNVTGHPALVMMAGLSSTGLPLSVQFAGRYFDEATVCRVAAACERVMGWQHRHPTLVARS